MNFEILPPAQTERVGYMRVNLQVLHEMLRLPRSIALIGCRVSDDGELLLDVRGVLPASGELTAVYDAIHTTIPVFKNFEPVS